MDGPRAPEHAPANLAGLRATLLVVEVATPRIHLGSLARAPSRRLYLMDVRTSYNGTYDADGCLYDARNLSARSVVYIRSPSTLIQKRLVGRRHRHGDASRSGRRPLSPYTR
jgi:hypothetical protein